MKESLDLKSWAVQYIKQRDLMRRDLVSFQEHEDRVACEYKEGHSVFYTWENLALDRLKGVKSEEISYFVCFCNEHNFKLLVDNWDLFKTKHNWTFIFLNPNFTERWIIKPFVHAKIADPSTLKQGLRTMYETCLGKEV
ncbi:hypothetical protein JW826_00765 [Candidatus Woesearchaeota archaeon]|nr:hypothetical protein [Candidatus Woesearchaeota archaeon]